MRQFNILTYDNKNNYIEESHVLGYIIYIDGHDCILHKSHIIGSEMWVISYFFYGLQIAKAESIESVLKKAEYILTKNKKIAITSMFLDSLLQNNIYMPINKK